MPKQVADTKKTNFSPIFTHPHVPTIDLIEQTISHTSN